MQLRQKSHRMSSSELCIAAAHAASGSVPSDASPAGCRQWLRRARVVRQARAAVPFARRSLVAASPASALQDGRSCPHAPRARMLGHSRKNMGGFRCTACSSIVKAQFQTCAIMTFLNDPHVCITGGSRTQHEDHASGHRRRLLPPCWKPLRLCPISPRAESATRRRSSASDSSASRTRSHHSRRRADSPAVSPAIGLGF